NYEVENMRVGNRTDFNKLRLFVETDGTLTPRAALEKSIEIMIKQLKSIIGFIEEEVEETKVEEIVLEKYNSFKRLRYCKWVTAIRRTMVECSSIAMSKFNFSFTI
ncbi:MAG: hypothetical protein WCI72_05420, partial [archaeon]